MSDDAKNLLRNAIELDDVSAVEAAIRAHPQLLNTPDSRPAVTLARTVDMAKRLLALGGDTEAVSKWWGRGMGLRRVDQAVATFLVEHGARLTVHAAAGLGLVDRLAEMLDADPALIDAKGGDGCTPLHFSRDCATANVLLAHGARVDARDEDHESTPAQWLIGEAPEVAQLLLEHGASPDIFLAAALGDRTLAEKLVATDPACLSCRIGKAPEFPPLGHEHRGGTIYQWTLAFNSYPHQVALLKGHTGLFDYLFENSDTTTRFLVSCVLARREDAKAIAARNPGLVASLPSVDLELLARYCWETNLNYDAVKLMLDLGFPLTHPETSHGYTALHNAAWAGAADLVELLLQRGHPVDIVDPAYHATPLGFAMHDCLVEKRHPEGEFARVVQLLLDAGSPWSALCYPTGEADVDNVLRPRLHLIAEGAALLGDEIAVFRLLGENPDPDNLLRALAGAAKGGHAALCCRLLEAGAPVTGTLAGDNNTPLSYALKSGSPETVAVLKEHGA
jgi:ankyrin repeat protein